MAVSVGAIPRTRLLQFPDDPGANTVVWRWDPHLIDKEPLREPVSCCRRRPVDAEHRTRSGPGGLAILKDLSAKKDPGGREHFVDRRSRQGDLADFAIDKSGKLSTDTNTESCRG